MEEVDVTIIGAGWSGCAALKTYRQVHPTAKITLIETAASVGGVWAKHRLYAGLKSNNMRGTYEFSDFPMDERFGVREGEHIPGAVIQQYMEAFLEHFELTPLVRLNTRVQRAHRNDDDTWTLTVAPSEDAAPDNSYQLHSGKLIVCTGITSQPYLPNFTGASTFPAPIFHCRDLLAHQDAVLQPGKRITVFGATKSGWDAVYAAATAGASVDWIMRDNGHGPCWMAPPYVTPLKKWLEKLVTTRFLTFFSPCIWGDADSNSSMRNFLHGSWVGRKMVDQFWSVLANDVIALNGYDAHPETAKLKPWISPFWIASSLSILNYPTDFFELVRSGKVRVHVDRIERLSAAGVHLASAPEEPLASDALICSTGWKATPNLEFSPPGLATTLGFPWAPDVLPDEVVRAADQEIVRRFPRLATPPQTANPKAFEPLSDDAPATASHPLRLARFMVPTRGPSRSIAFMGLTMTINTTMIAQAQALWIAAWFGGELAPRARETCPAEVVKTLQESLVGEEKQQPEQVDVDWVWESALHSQFGVHRYPGGFGKRNPDFVFDAVPYVDLLLGDLGLDIGRKPGGMKWFEPYGVEDYRGLVEEYLARRK